MSMSLVTNLKRIESLLNVSNTVSESSKRWHSAFVAIYCSRALMTNFNLTNTNKTKAKASAKLTPTPSFTVVDLNPDQSFDIDQTTLAHIVKEKDLESLETLGGVEGVATALETHVEYGIKGGDDAVVDDITRRKQMFGSNTYIKPPSKAFFHSVVEAFKDVKILIGLIFAALSLGFGIKEHGLKEGCQNGVIILFSVFIVINVSSISRFRPNRQFHKLSQARNDMQIDVVRSGSRQHVSSFEIVVGDVICLKIGDQVPADGLFIEGHSLKVDESIITGDSDHVEISRHHHPFLFFGTKVVDGYAKMLVTSVGMNTTWGQMMSSISSELDEDTPLQERIKRLTSSIGKVGSAVAFIVLVVLLVRYFTGNTKNDKGVREFNGSKTKFDDIMNAVVGIVAYGLPMIGLSIPEGLPLAVTLTLAYSMKKMMADRAMVIKFCACKTMGSATTICTDKTGTLSLNGSKAKFDMMMNVAVIATDALVIVAVEIVEGLPLVMVLAVLYLMKKTTANKAMERKLCACETMGSATTICTDKTGTLTLNQMRVTKFWLGLEPVVEIGSVHSKVARFVLQLIQEGVALNTTGSVQKSDKSGSEFEFSGSPTEKAILSWAVLELNMDMEHLTKGCSIIHVETFNSNKKRSGVLLRRKEDNRVTAHWKGAAEMVLKMCSRYYDASGTVKDLDNDRMMKFEHIIQGMAASSLRCIAFAHVEVAEEELVDEDGSTVVKMKENGLTLLGLVGIKDPCRPGAKEAVETCQRAGVNVKMITGDNVFTTMAIATECGILQPDQDRDEAVVEGERFRNYTPEERLEKVDKICVMTRSSPLDKFLMVQCLKRKGHVVAVIGDGKNDAPSLKEADIGLSMGIQGTEVAKESSDIVILDGNFASVVTVLMWGRCVYNNIQKFIQFRLTMNVAALAINFVGAVSSGELPLTAGKLLWVNLIKEAFGSFALATENPTMELMDKPPIGRTKPLITNVMWRNLLAQALYQIAILLALQFKGESIFGVTSGVNDTLIFNTFILCQVFNEFNARKLEKRNVFKGIHRSKLFIGIIGFTIILQVVMIEFLKKFADTERLNWGQWGICIALAAISWPIGWVVKLIPVPDKPLLNI